MREFKPPGFCTSSPTGIKCYTLLWYYLPIFIKHGGLDFDYGNQPQIVRLQHLVTIPAVVALFLLSGFMLSLFYRSSSSSSTIPTIFTYLQAWLIYNTTALKVAAWNPSFTVLLSMLLNQHILWTMTQDLSGFGRRKIVGGVIVRAMAQGLLFLLPALFPLLSPFIVTHPKDLVPIIFSPEIFGIAVDILNHVCLSSVAVFI